MGAKTAFYITQIYELEYGYNFCLYMGVGRGTCFPPLAPAAQHAPACHTPPTCKNLQTPPNLIDEHL